jgi:hypothetical protein
VIEQELLTKPSDLRFWHPTGIGFLTKETQEIFKPQTSTAKLQYLATDEFVAKPGETAKVLHYLRKAAAIAQKDDSVLTFWVQDRVGSSNGRAERVDNDKLGILVRCRHKQAFDAFLKTTKAVAWDPIAQLSDERRTTTWVESGIGFIGR